MHTSRVNLNAAVALLAAIFTGTPVHARRRLPNSTRVVR